MRKFQICVRILVTQGGTKVLIDYGKMAYIKINQLEKRIETLEKDLAKSVYNTLFFDFTTPEKLTNFDKSVKFISNGDTAVKVEILISIPSSTRLQYQVKHNESLIKSGYCQSLESVITFDLGAHNGENTLELIISSQVELEFNYLKLTLGGQIDYHSQKRKLSLSTTTYSDYVAYQNGDFATVYSYYSGSLVNVLEYSGILDISLLGFDGNKLYIGLVNENNELKIETLTERGERYASGQTLAKNVSSVCGYLNENGVSVVFSKAGEIMLGNYQIGSEFAYEKTGRRGLLVSADSDVLGAYVVHGDYRPTKLVDGFATYVLEKGENYHITKTYGGYAIRYGAGGRLYKQEINGGVLNPVKLSTYDEIIRLCDGKYIKRVRDVLTVGKEENV